VDAGLTPYEALRTGTVNPASYFNRSNSGIIKTGNDADLTLLNGNPLKDISQTQNIEGVMLGNNWLPKKFINETLQRLEKK
jgi:imidazolonepropionase-like amidohydrolase